MEFEQSPIQGVILIKPKVFGDNRGLFVETWQKERYEEIGITYPFVQDNHSRSVYGVLRGLHYQSVRRGGGSAGWFAYFRQVVRGGAFCGKSMAALD